MPKRGVRSEHGSRSPSPERGRPSPQKRQKSTEVEGNCTVGPKCTVTLGGEKLNAFGLGTLALGVTYSGRPEEEEAIAVIHAAIDAGCQLIDTADTYCHDGKELHYAERLVAKALAQHPRGAEVRVATKGGMVRINAQSSGWREARQTPEDIHRMITESHAALGGKEPIFLWQLHHVNSGRGADGPELARRTVAVMKAAEEMVEAGKVLHIGLCNATVEQIDACFAAGINVASIQNKFSVFHKTAEKPLPSGRKAGKTSPLGVLEACERYGIPFLCYAPLGGLPIRQGKVTLAEKAKALVPVAKRLGVSLQALMLAVMHDRWPCMAFITGARTAAHARDSIATPPLLQIDEDIADLF